MVSNNVMPRQSNRRSSARRLVTTHAQIECRPGSYGFGPNILKNVVNLSETGICVVVKPELKKGSEVEVLFAGADQGKALKRVARVVWIRPQNEEEGWCLGLHFQAPLPYAALLRLVRPS